MKAQWDNPVCYARFTARLKKMTLADAIARPRVEYQVRDQSSKTPIQDNIRRTQRLKEERIPILDLDELERIEKERMPRITHEDLEKVIRKRREIRLHHKQSLWKRILNRFKWRW